VSADYEPLGCYNLKKLKQQNVVSQIFKKFTAKPGSPLKDCAQKAEEINTPLFGIQKKKGKILCRAGDEAKWDPNAKISNKCKNSIGIGNSVFVYRKSRITGNKIPYLSHSVDRVRLRKSLRPLHSVIVGCVV